MPSIRSSLYNNHYGVDADADTSCKIYTIGMGIEQLSGSERNIARLAFESGYLYNWKQTMKLMQWRPPGILICVVRIRQCVPSGHRFLGNIEYSNYTFRHPSSGDHLHHRI